MKSVLQSCRLYGIVDLGYVAPLQVGTVTRALIEGGVRILQLRAKGVELSLVQRLAVDMQAICREHGCIFVLNDYPDMAAAIGADAVHVGQDGGPLFPTGTKPGRAAIGLQDIAAVRAAVGDMPMFCIGGVNGDTLPQVLAAGAERVVIVSWLLLQANIAATAATVIAQLGGR